MYTLLRPALTLLFAAAGAVLTVSDTRSEAPPPAASQPAAKPAPPRSSGSTPTSKPAAGTAATTQPASKPAEPSVRTPPRVSADDVLKAFQKDRPTLVPIAPSAAPDESAPRGAGGAAGTSLRLPDGFFLVDRVGRVVRDGEWYVFVYEGYNESHPEPPVKLLPNQLLERMVIESAGGTNNTVFIVSGEVTEFQNENFLLLRKLLRRRNLGNLEK
jgi:hypothetical protein